MGVADWYKIKQLVINLLILFKSRVYIRFLTILCNNGSNINQSGGKIHTYKPGPVQEIPYKKNTHSLCGIKN